MPESEAGFFVHTHEGGSFGFFTTRTLEGHLGIFAGLEEYMYQRGRARQWPSRRAEIVRLAETTPREESAGRTVSLIVGAGSSDPLNGEEG